MTRINHKYHIFIFAACELRVCLAIMLSSVLFHDSYYCKSIRPSMSLHFRCCVHLAVAPAVISTIYFLVCKALFVIFLSLFCNKILLEMQPRFGRTDLLRWQIDIYDSP